MTHLPAFPAPAPAPRQRAGLILAGGVVTLLALVGCSAAASEPAASLAPSATAPQEGTDAPSEASTPSATSSATPSPTPSAAGTRVALSCDQVLTAEDLYAYNPNVGTAPGFSPESGSRAATAAQYDGVACGLLNQSSGATISIGIAAPNQVLRNQLYDAAVTQSQPVPTYGDAPTLVGFFTSASGVGEAQIFTDTYWVTLSSVEFFEPGDAQNLLATVVSHLP